MKQFLTTILIFTGLLSVPLINVSAQNTIVISGNSISNQSSQNSISSNAQSKKNLNLNEFNANEIISDDQIYSLPAKFDSADKIRIYLKNQGSFLANYKVDIGFEVDDDLWNTVSVKQNMGQYAGKQMDFAEFVWKMSQTEMANSCSFINKNVCIDQKVRPINPALLLALIQRESGLIRGKNAKLDPNSNTAKFLIDRSMAYMCNDSSDDTQNCYDQNPDWKYFKGMFRQVYYGTRLLLINARRCELGTYRNYRVGNTVNIDGENIKLENGFTCSSYIYTPHSLSQKALYKVFKDVIA
jgi:hypothetical protein